MASQAEEESFMTNGGSKWANFQIRTSRECCLRPVRRRVPSTRLLGGGAGWGPLCATRTGPSYTTCVGPDRNGARSTRAALGGRAGRTCAKYAARQKRAGKH